MEFWISFFGALFGCGLGGTIVYLAGQKFIENTTSPKFEELEKKIKFIDENKVSLKDFEKHEKEQKENLYDIKNEFVPIKMYEQSQKFLGESLKEIKEMIRYLTEKMDKKVI